MPPEPENYRKILPWTEKYRPETLQGIVGNAAAKSAMSKWAQSWGKDSWKAILLAGPPGTGKTSAAIALAREMGWDYVELNASDERSEKEIRRIAVPGSFTNSFTESGNYVDTASGRRHVIILDEADNLHAREDRGGIAAISSMIEETRQPVILIANDIQALTRRSSAIKKLCKIIHFNPLTSREIIMALKNIARAESLTISDGILEEIARKSGGDLRAAVNDLQSVAAGSGPQEIFTRSSSLDAKRGLGVLFRAKTIRDARNAVSIIDEEPSYLNFWLEGNIYSKWTNPALERSLEALSNASLFARLAGKHSYYRLWSYAYDMIALAYWFERVSLSSREEIRFPIILGKLSARNAMLNRKAALYQKVAEYSHTSLDKVRDSTLNTLKYGFAHSRAFAKEMVRKLDLSQEDVSVLLEIEEDDPLIKDIFRQAS